MTSQLPRPPYRQVTLRYRAPETAPRLTADMNPAQVEAIQQAAERLGLPRHPDPQLAALLAAVRLRDDVPPGLYAATAAILGIIYAAEDEP